MSQACIKGKKKAHQVKTVFFQFLICFLSIHRFSSWHSIDLKPTEINGTIITGGKVTFSKGQVIKNIQHRSALFSTWSSL